MLTAAYVVYAIAQAVPATWACRLYRPRPSVGALALMLPIAAVIYDNVMVALGPFIGDGRAGGIPGPPAPSITMALVLIARGDAGVLEQTGSRFTRCSRASRRR